MKLTKQQVLDLYNALQGVGNLQGAKFSYAVAKNIKKIQPEVDALNAAYAPSTEYQEYDKVRAALAEKFAKKVDGKPQIVFSNGSQVYDIDDQGAFDAELKTLQEEHKAVIDAREKQLNDFKELLKEEVDIEIHTIAPEYLPENINAEQMSGIISMVEEERKLG